MGYCLPSLFLSSWLLFLFVFSIWKMIHFFSLSHGRPSGLEEGHSPHLPYLHKTPSLLHKLQLLCKSKTYINFPFTSYFSFLHFNKENCLHHFFSTSTSNSKSPRSSSPLQPQLQPWIWIASLFVGSIAKDRVVDIVDNNLFGTRKVL